MGLSVLWIGWLGSFAVGLDRYAGRPRKGRSPWRRSRVLGPARPLRLSGLRLSSIAYRDRLSSNPSFPLNFAQGPPELAQGEDLLSLRIAQDVAHSWRSSTASSHWSTSQRSTGRFCRDHDWPDLGDHRGWKGGIRTAVYFC